jgi:hypothetical protein
MIVAEIWSPFQERSPPTSASLREVVDRYRSQKVLFTSHSSNRLEVKGIRLGQAYLQHNVGEEQEEALLPKPPFGRNQAIFLTLQTYRELRRGGRNSTSIYRVSLRAGRKTLMKIQSFSNHLFLELEQSIVDFVSHLPSEIAKDSQNSV